MKRLLTAICSLSAAASVFGAQPGLGGGTLSPTGGINATNNPGSAGQALLSIGNGQYYWGTVVAQSSNTINQAAGPGVKITTNSATLNTFQVDTNQPMALNGSFAGDLNKGTNIDGGKSINAMTVDTNTIGNIDWLRIRSSSFEPYTNQGRYSYRKTMAKWAKQQQVRIQFDGTGLVEYPECMFSNVINSLSAERPFAGFMTSWFPGLGGSQTFGINQSFSNIEFHAKDTNWYGSCYWTTNASGITTNTATYAFDTFEVDYIGSPDGGTFKIQTNGVDVSGYTALTTVASSRTGLAVRVTLPAPITGYFTLVSTGAGTNRFVNTGAWNSTITNGFIVGGFHQASSFSTNYLTPNWSNIVAPIYRSMAPDMLVWNNPQGYVMYTNYVTGAHITNLFNFWDALTNTEVIYCSCYPFAADSVDPYTNSPTKADELARSLVLQHGFSYFDGNYPFESYSNFMARGFGFGDGVHANQVGYATYSQFFWTWLGLDNALLLNNNASLITTGTLLPPYMGTNTQIIAGANVTITTNYSNGVITYTIAGSAGGSGGVSAPGFNIAVNTNGSVYTLSTSNNPTFSTVTTTNTAGTNYLGVDTYLNGKLVVSNSITTYGGGNSTLSVGGAINSSNQFQIYNPSGQTTLTVTTNSDWRFGTNSGLRIDPTGVVTGNLSGGTNYYSTNLVGRAYHITNVVANASVPDASRVIQDVVLTTGTNVAGFANLISGIRSTFSVCYSNSTGSTVIITNPATAVIIGPASTNQMNLPSGKMGYWSFDIIPGVKTNYMNVQ